MKEKNIFDQIVENIAKEQVKRDNFNLAIQEVKNYVKSVR